MLDQKKRCAKKFTISGTPTQVTEFKHSEGVVMQGDCTGEHDSICDDGAPEHGVI
jgi:hypothetical protein